MAILPGKFVWFECVTPDLAASQRFYGEVLGWTVQPIDAGRGVSYSMIHAGDKPVGGWTTTEPGRGASWIPYVAVLSVDAALHAIAAAGGTVLAPAFDMPGVGRMAKVADPEGAALWVMQTNGTDEPDAPPAAGRFTWNELCVSDGRKALAFYGRAFGYMHNVMDMGSQGTYHLLSASGAPRAGITALLDAEPHWLPHIAVDDCDAAVERAHRLGATVEVAAEEIPGIGRFAVLRDPAGARFAVMRPAVRAG